MSDLGRKKSEGCAKKDWHPIPQKQSRSRIYKGVHLIDFIKVGGSERISKFQIVGFLDEHRSFRGRLLRCFKVFGGLDQLEELSKKGRLDGLVVTISNLSDERWAELMSETKAHGLKLYRWGCDKDFRLVGESPNKCESRADS